MRVVITLRADFYHRPLQYPDFGDLLRRQMETVLPLSASELERAIVRPAERIGLRFEDGLVPIVFEDVHYQPGALPLMQYALTELFDRREEQLLTRSAYETMGGTMGALAGRAENLYQELDAGGQEVTRQLFLRLATVEQSGDGGEMLPVTRRRVTRSEYLAKCPGGRQSCRVPSRLDIERRVRFGDLSPARRGRMVQSRGTTQILR